MLRTVRPKLRAVLEKPKVLPTVYATWCAQHLHSKTKLLAVSSVVFAGPDTGWKLQWLQFCHHNFSSYSAL
eukprot:2274571-Amphidinium_carterae.1